MPANDNKQIKHLLIFTPGFPGHEEETNCLPAVQQFILCHKKVFPETAISIISLHYPFAPARYTWHNVPVQSLGGRNRSGIYTPLIIGRAVREGLKLNTGAGFDAVLCFWLRDSAAAGHIVSRLARVPCLVWMHGQDAKSGNKYMRRLSVKGTDLAAISDWQNEVLHKAYGIRAGFVLNNGINPDVFPPFNEGHRSIDLLAAGSFIPLKQYHLFVALVKHVKENGHPDVKAVLCGDGELFDELKALVLSYDLADNLMFTDRVAHGEVLRLMNNTRIFIHPSCYEGQSTVMLEALYSGCKVLAFIPPGDTPSGNFILCPEFSGMKKACLLLMKKKLVHKSESYSDMSHSVRKLHDILLIKKEYANNR